MKKLNPDRAQARRLTLCFQAAVGVLLLAAVAVGGLTLTASEAPTRLAPLEPTTPTTRAGSAASPVRLEAEAISTRFNQIPNRPVVLQAEKPGPTVDTTPAQAPAGLAAHVRYLGPVMSGKKMMALIAVDGRQRFVSVGDEFSIGPPELGRKARVISISAEEIVLDEGKGNVTISRAERSGLAVGRSSAPSSQPLNPVPIPAPRIPGTAFHQGPGGSVLMQNGAMTGVERRELAEKMRILDIERQQEEMRLMAEKLGEGRGSPDSVGLDDGKGGGPK